MTVKITRLKPPTPPAPPPEPLYAARIKAALKALHPLFLFTLERLDIRTTIDFSISFRDLVIDGHELYPQEKPFLFGTFPGFLFDRQEAEAEDFAIADQYRRFEEYLFKVVARFLFDVVHQGTARERDRLCLLTAGGDIDWDQALHFLNLATCRLPMFNRLGGEASAETFDVFLVPGAWQVRLSGGMIQDERSCLAVNVAGMDRAGLQAGVREIAAAEGVEHANWKLKQHLQNLVVSSLYHMRWVPL